MKWHYLVLTAAILLTGCATGLRNLCIDGGDMILAIRWQRLVDEEGKTCDRCGGTQEELSKAVDALRQALSPLGMQVTLEENSLSPEDCAEDIMESNRIWIADRPLEDWLGADVGATDCGSCCAQLGETVQCRTTSLGGETYEVIPAQLIVKSGLLAASQIIEIPSASSCCPSANPKAGPGGKCCP
jgi:hypothetical protein